MLLKYIQSKLGVLIEFSSSEIRDDSYGEKVEDLKDIEEAESNA